MRWRVTVLGTTQISEDCALQKGYWNNVERQSKAKDNAEVDVKDRKKASRKMIKQQETAHLERKKTQSCARTEQDSVGLSDQSIAHQLIDWYWLKWHLRNFHLDQGKSRDEPWSSAHAPRKRFILKTAHTPLHRYGQPQQVDQLASAYSLMALSSSIVEKWYFLDSRSLDQISKCPTPCLSRLARSARAF